MGHLPYLNSLASWTSLEEENNYTLELIRGIKEENNKIIGRIFSLFQTPIEDILKNKFQLMIQDTKCPTTVSNTWYYWEYEEYIKLLNEKNKEETEQQKKQQENQSSQMNSSKFNPSSVMKQYNPSTFMNNFGNNTSFPRI